MHAYASRDPVFRAMNKRGQEEAQLGDFCVQCHAPMAVREKKIKDFADLSDVPEHLQGVTCYFCHNAVGVKGHNNAQIELADDTVMRGVLSKPVKPPAHAVSTKPSRFHDRSNSASAELCGSCHDIVNPNGFELERTFAEYQQSVQATSPPGLGFMTCQECHMKRKPNQGLAAPGYDGQTRARYVHWHHFPAVDVALTPGMPHQDILRASIENCELQAGTVSGFQVQLQDGWFPGEPFTFVVELEHSAGHNIPSGASADRRLWIEVVAYDDTDQIVFESGRIKDGELEEKPKDDPGYDPQFRPFRDYLLDADGNETHMFWEAAKLDRRSELIPFATTTVVGSHTARRTFTAAKLRRPAPRIELWLRLRPMGIDVLQDLVQSGHLDPAVIEAMPTFTLTHENAIYDPAANAYSMETPEEFDDGKSCEKFAEMFDAVTKN
jgi:hypothetical protein